MLERNLLKYISGSGRCSSIDFFCENELLLLLWKCTMVLLLKVSSDVRHTSIEFM